MENKTMRNLLLLCSVLAFVVVVLGAYVRLSDAGLGCPDWPTCYGSVGVPQSESAIDAANQAYPDRPLEAHKAWKEMIHRYLATALGFLILIIFIINVKRAIKHQSNQLGLSLLLLLMVIAQGALGAFTVTMKVKPIIVTAHLAGGMLTLAVIWLLFLRNAPSVLRDKTRQARRSRPMFVFGFLVLFMQVLLGGWVSTNYAALSCPDLPTCQGKMWPDADYKEGFVLWRGVGPDYEGGVLDNRSRVAIHMAHRMGAIIASLVLLGVCSILLTKPVAKSTRRVGYFLLYALIAQVALGLSNVLFSLPIDIATAHNAGAAILILTMVTLLYKTSYRAPKTLITPDEQ